MWQTLRPSMVTRAFATIGPGRAGAVLGWIGLALYGFVFLIVAGLMLFGLGFAAVAG